MRCEVVPDNRDRSQLTVHTTTPQHECEVTRPDQANFQLFTQSDIHYCTYHIVHLSIQLIKRNEELEESQ